MTLTELQTYLRSATGTNSAILADTNCNFFVNGAVDLMQQAHLWRVQETISSDTPYAANTTSVSLPSGCIVERAVYIKNTASGAVGSTLYWWVPRIDRGRWFEESPDTDRLRDAVFPQVAQPGASAVDGLYYTIWAESLFLYPTPTSAQTVVVDYYKRATDLSTGSDTNVFTSTYAHVVRQGALAEAYEFLHEEERAAMARARFEAMLARAILDDKQLAAGGGGYTRGA